MPKFFSSLYIPSTEEHVVLLCLLYERSLMALRLIVLASMWEFHGFTHHVQASKRHDKSKS